MLLFVVREHKNPPSGENTFSQKHVLGCDSPESVKFVLSYCRNIACTALSSSWSERCKSLALPSLRWFNSRHSTPVTHPDELVYLEKWHLGTERRGSTARHLGGNQSVLG